MTKKPDIAADALARVRSALWAEHPREEISLLDVQALVAEVERLRAQVAPAGLAQRYIAEDDASISNVGKLMKLGRELADATLAASPAAPAQQAGHAAFALEALAAAGHVTQQKVDAALSIASNVLPAQQADPKRELLQRIVDGATPGEGNLTASLRAVAADALAAPSSTVGEESDHAEFEVWEGDELFAGTSGPRSQAWTELLRYAAQCEGVVRVFEVSRVERSLSHVPAQGVEDERAAFEAWRKSVTGLKPHAWREVTEVPVEPSLLDRYITGIEQQRWEAWQARAALAKAPAAEPLTDDAAKYRHWRDHAEVLCAELRYESPSWIDAYLSEALDERAAQPSKPWNYP